MKSLENASGIGRDFKRAAGAKRRSRSPVAKPFTFRLSDDERALLIREAGNLSLAAHVRRKLLGESVSARRGRKLSRKRHVPQVDQVALGQALAMLGRSELAQRLDDLTTAAVIGALPVGPELVQELHAVCAYIREMRAALMNALNVEQRFEE